MEPNAFVETEGLFGKRPLLPKREDSCGVQLKSNLV